MSPERSLSREVGGAVGIAVLASVLTAAYQSHLPASAGAARASVAIAAHLGGPVFAAAQAAFADGMQLALRIAAGLVLGAAIVIAALLRDRQVATRPGQD